MLAALKVAVQGNSPLGGTTLLLNDLAKMTELDSSELLVQLRGKRRVLWLPDHLRRMALQMGHNHPTSAYAGFFWSLKHISGRLVWIGMQADIAVIYVHCCRVLPPHKGPLPETAGIMSSMSGPRGPWKKSESTSSAPCPPHIVVTVNSLWPLINSPSSLNCFPCAAPRARMHWVACWRCSAGLVYPYLFLVTMAGYLVVRYGKEFFNIGASRTVTQCHINLLGRWSTNIMEP